MVTKFLSSAIDYYCNVDDLGVKDGCEADRRLRGLWKDMPVFVNDLSALSWA